MKAPFIQPFRLRFRFGKPDGVNVPGRILLIDPVSVPTVSELSKFVAEKLDLDPNTILSFYLDTFLVEHDESIAVFKEDEVVHVR
jgi:hypothetical protein